MLDADLAIIGSGFGGSILAMIARRLGYRVMLFERGRHPRFAIGESASPLAGVLIEQLADRYDLPRLRPLSAFGTWQRTGPSTLSVRFRFMRFDAAGQLAGFSLVTRQVTVAADGQSATGQSTVDIQDASGTPVASGCADDISARLP